VAAPATSMVVLQPLDRTPRVKLARTLQETARGVTVADKAVTALFTGVVRVRLSTTLALNH